MSESGKLEKLKIVAFSDMEQDNEIGKFEAYYNPATYSASYSIKYADDGAQGETKRTMKYTGFDPATFSFELLLDGTGASVPDGISSDQPGSDGKKISVADKVEAFMDIAYRYKGDVHRPAYLQINWGKSTIAKCVLTSVSVTYDLFEPSGNPLRAKLGCQFKEYSYEDLTKAEENSASPNMTHLRVVKQGDKLPLMCKEIYGDPLLYLEVARINGLTDYRDLQAGQELYFPPLVNRKS